MPLYDGEPDPHSASHTATGDLDGDGRPDLVVTEEDRIGVRYNRTPVASLTAPALTSGSVATIRWSVDAFRAAVSALELQVLRPGAASWTPLAKIASPGASGTVDSALGEEGDYRFRALARDRSGQVLEVSEPAEATTRVDRTPAPTSTPSPTPTATATPTPTPTPDPVQSEMSAAVTVPLPTERPAAPAPAASGPELAYDVQVGRKTTRLIGLRVTGLSPRSKVTVRCARGCSRKTFTTVKARGTLSLASFAKRRLPAGTTIRITIAEPGKPAVVATVKIRAGRAPSETVA